MNADLSFGEHVWRNNHLRGLILCFRKDWTPDEAAKHGLLVVFVERGNSLGGWYSYRTAELAARHGHLHVLQWLQKNKSHAVQYHHTFAMAAGGGHVHVMKWLHELGHSEFEVGRALDTAASNGHTEAVRWLTQTFGAWRGGVTNAAQLAKRRGYHEIAELLHDPTTRKRNDCERDVAVKEKRARET